MTRLAFAALVLAALARSAGAATAEAGWDSVRLSWTAPGDDSLVGLASAYDLRYSTSPITAANFGSATRVPTPAPSPPGTRESVLVAGLRPRTAYYFAIRTADEVPNWSALSNVLRVATLSEPLPVAPETVGVEAKP